MCIKLIQGNVYIFNFWYVYNMEQNDFVLNDEQIYFIQDIF